MNFLNKLREAEPSSATAYHLEGLLESYETIRALLDKLGDATLDAEGTAETLTYLQVEIYAHLAYHLKELRRPLKKLILAAYKHLPDIGEAEGSEWAEAAIARARTALEAGRKK